MVGWGSGTSAEEPSMLWERTASRKALSAMRTLPEAVNTAKLLKEPWTSRIGSPGDERDVISTGPSAELPW